MGSEMCIRDRCRSVIPVPGEFAALFQTADKVHLVNGYNMTDATTLFSSPDLLTTIATESFDAIPGYDIQLCGSLALPDDGPVYIAGGYNANFSGTPSAIFPPTLFELNGDGDGFDLLTTAAPWPGRALSLIHI